VKRRPELRDLSDDHHTGLVLAIRCKRAGGGREEDDPGWLWAQVERAFAEHLEPHFRIEEEHLLPALETIGEARLAARIRDDHAALREMRDVGAADTDAVRAFGALLETHIRFEEREVFEPTQDRLPKAALEAIAAACRAIPRTCPSTSTEPS
jgi:hypothetical protein